MSLTTAENRARRGQASPHGSAEFDRFIERRLSDTSSQVKLTDLFSALMVLLGGLLLAVLLLAVIDHWIIGLSPAGRWLAWFLTAAGVLGYIGLVVGPLVFRHINPAFAARVIEQSEPSLKNSLINFLLFRSDRAGVSAAIYSALQQRAAADLSKVQVESAVDRGHLIKVGYGLAAVMALFAVYTMLSPKSPFQTLQRVAAPWADIARPSRVRIEQVQPGTIQAFHGDQLQVSAQVYDIREGEPVQLFFSTKDSQVTAASVAMQATEGGLRFEAKLPPGTDGLQQDLDYWIVAGDARTDVFRVTVQEAPTIWVERVEYNYPTYTQRPPRVVPRQGDIQGLEGTRVTIHAQTNAPIRAATIELLPPGLADDAEREKPVPDRQAREPGTERVKVVEMRGDGQTAAGSFSLELDATRSHPLYAAYQLRFVTQEGQRTRRPVLHRLEVTPDLPPEIEILTPARNRVEIPEDGRQTIEARAIDPDFRLRKITLRAVSAGASVLERTLLDDAEGRPGQVMVNFLFRPRELRLTAGAEVVYWLVAEDNRRSVGDASPEPNSARTPDYHFVILPPEKPDGFGTQAAKPKPKPDPDEPPKPEERPQDEPQPKQGGDKGGADKQQMGGKDDQAAGSGGEGGEKTDKQSGDGQSGGQGEKSKDGSQSGQGSQGGQKSDASSPQGDSAANSGGERTGQPGDPNAGTPSESADGPGSGQGMPQESPHDGDVFEKLLDRMKQQGAKPSPDQGTSAGQPQPGEAGQEAAPNAKPTGDPQDARPEQAGKSPSAPDPKPTEGSGRTADDVPPDAATGANRQQPGQAQPQSQGEMGKPDKNLGGGPEQGSEAGQGGSPQGPAETAEQPKASDQGGGDQRQPGEGTNGQSGAGEPGADKQGSVSPMEKNRDRQKEGMGSGAGEKPKENPEPQSPSLSSKQSDSQGPEGGDRSGGGKPGSGQGANKPGQDSAGSNTPSDEGAGAANDPGSGDTSKAPGDKQQSKSKTGAKGDSPGPGSGSQPGDKQAGGAGSASGAKPGGPQSPSGPGSPQGNSPDHDRPGLPAGGGPPKPGATRSADLAGEAPPEEKPKLEYTRKATDLVLEYLKDQQQKPDEQLLRDLGWTPNDLRQFIARWEALKGAAAESEAGRRDLEESLRSLGLRPDRSAPRRVSVREDQPGGLRDTGTRSSPPSTYLDQFHAYQKGTARTESNRKPASGANNRP